MAPQPLLRGKKRENEEKKGRQEGRQGGREERQEGRQEGRQGGRDKKILYNKIIYFFNSSSKYFFINSKILSPSFHSILYDFAP